MKSNATLLLLCTAFLYSTAFAQTKIKLQKVAGGRADDNFSCLIVTADSGTLAGGTSYSGISGNKTDTSRGVSDYWIVKYNKAGAIEWDKTIGSNSIDLLTTLQQTTDGGYILGGSSYGGVSGDKTTEAINYEDYWLVKLDKNGNIQWDKTISDTTINSSVGDEFILLSLQQTSDNGYILAGIAYTSDNEYFNSIWVVKLDSSGNMQWSNEVGAGTAAIIQQTPDGGYILGSSIYYRGDDEVYVELFKLNKNGKQVWHKLYDDPDVASASLSSLVQIENGYILGCTALPYTYDWLLIRTDTAGNEINHKHIGGSGYDVLTSLQRTSDGGLIAGGYSNSDSSGNKTENSRGGYDYWIVKLNATGKIMWDKTYGGSSDDKLLTVKERNPGEFILGGSSSSGASKDKRLPSMGGVDYWGIVIQYTAPAINITKAALPDFSVFPNPATNKINIYTKSKAEFMLFNQLGRLITSKVIESKGSIDVSTLTPGIYFITNLSTGKKQSVIIER